MATNEDPDHANKKLRTTEERNDSESFLAREYQIEILEEAMRKNTIACLGTGTGKTFIAVLLIRENANEVRIPFEEGGKRIFFLVPTVPLVNQQKLVISKHTDLKVKGFFGEMQVDSWSIDDWRKEFIASEVLVMTAEIFRIILDHAFISPKQIQLLIFDECHRAQKDHPYRQAMKYLHDKQDELPRIFGLSASLLNGKCKPTQLEKRLKELEATMLCGITTASDIAELQKYGTDPDEYVVYFSSYVETAANLMNQIEKVTANLKNDKAVSESQLTFEGPLLSDEFDVIFFDKPVKCLNSLRETLKVLGPWCTYKAAEIYLREIKSLLQRPFSDKYKDSLEIVYKFLGYVMSQCLILNGNTLEIREAFLPDKLKRLLQIFVAARNCERISNPAVDNVEVDYDFLHLLKSPKRIKSKVQISSIIFVKLRITAYVLCEWLKEIKTAHSDLDFLKPDFIVGHGSLGLTETAMSEKLQRKKVRAFRNEDCNVLVATCVLEEGMDIRQCNVVVRFDLPPEFRSYVQSKGRARAKNSIYVLMVEDGLESSKFLQDVCNFKTIEKLLLSRCYKRSLPSEEDISEVMADNIIAPYMPYGVSGPRITMTSAVSLINRYCSNLPSDMATKLVPRWTIQKVDPLLLESEYVCELKMPINSPLRKTIISEPMRKMKLAKMSAALKVCQALHDIGELNDHLVPISCLVEKALDEELGDIEKEETEDGTIPGTNRRRQLYDKHVNEFPVFTKCGKIMIGVSLLNRPLFLSAEEIQRIEEFHRFLFSDALRLETGGKTFDPGQHSYYILPTNINQRNRKMEVDWDFIYSVKDNIYHEQLKGSKNSHNVFDENLFRDAVLLRSYKLKTGERPTLHYVMRIMKELTPNSIFDPKTGETFKYFYKTEYDVDIVDENQPLVETVQYASTHLWKPIYLSPKEVFEDSSELSKSKQRRRDYHEYLVPELCFRHPFPASFLFQVLCLPTALFRLNGLLLAEEIRQAVSNQMKVGGSAEPQSWRPFHLETSDKTLREYLFRNKLLDRINPADVIDRRDVVKKGNYIVSFEIKEDLSLKYCPSPSMLLQALTTKSAGDEFDLERLEMIGDSFLKYVMSIKAYMKYQNFDEGKLTLFRSRLIQNLNLYQKAKKKGLGEYMTTTTFSCSSTWLPPCYTIEEQIDKKSILVKKEREKITDEVLSPEVNQHKYFTKQVVSDKSVADSVEALIGAYLLTSGPKGALKFMSWLGLKPLLSETDDFDNWPPTPSNPILPDAVRPEQRIAGFTSGFDRFEKKIGYTFKNKAYLLQAFTHQSYHYNDITDCYQRLEFLGDAVLDYLITRQLYEDPHDHSPGKLTDLRSALVNNIFFASLAVAFSYHEFLKIASPNLFKLMSHYIELLEDTQEFKDFQKDLYYLKEVECFELEEVEVPKALGDVFESVAGAIYLDSGMSLDAVWNVYFPMIKPSLDHLTEYVPKSPIRELYEMEPKLMFGKPINLKTGKTKIEVFLPNGNKYDGVGPNKKVAKRSAAKRALADMKRMDFC
ncbi:endoribonuclease Dicer isoform X2 [Parasteatoda tepidariorum]|uniref:endoribonuclease Dicer isoform X2 n=1 Tax=Parasteatoda tepidariorum TaxID=114398 RepID=UPI0039BD4BAA